LLRLERVDSRFLLRLSKYLLIGGVCIAAIGFLFNGHLGPLVGIEVIAILTILCGLYLRRKAAILHRRFDWRDGHVPA
jgi:uncharacterized membrane protein YfcA